jgi:hypothetical protein
MLSNARACRAACFRPTRGFYTVALLLLTFLFAALAKATHVVGGQLSYTFLSANGASNTYRIRLSLFRDCAGVNLQSTSSVTYYNANTNQALGSLTLAQQGTLIDRSIVCAGQQSRCTNPASTIPGVQEFIYEGNLTLPATQDFPIRVAHSTCCRANGITNLNNPGGQETYLSTNIPAQNLTLNNNSPVFLNPPNGVFCQNQLASLSLNAFDPDGEALVYSLVSARRGGVGNPLPCNYLAPFTATSPMSSSTPVTINPATGIINFTPTVLNQRSVVAVRVEEFRNGNKIGEVFRDLEVTTISCGSNTAPVIAPINNQVVQVGQTLCIPVSVTDANGNNITVTATGGIIPPATFTITSSGAGFTNGQFCFTPTLANAANTYAISINAVDNFCPIPSSVVSTFNITVPCPNAIPLQTSSTPASCGLSDGSATASMPGGVPPFAYSWTGPGGFTGSSATINNVPAGSYSITVVDGNSCTGSSVVTVAGSATSITLSGPVNDAQCGQNNGSLDLSANGGVAPYTFSLNGGAAQGNGQFANLAPGTYTITVLDANACPATATYVITAAADATPPTALCKNVTLYLDANGNANIFPADVDNGSFDNCNSISLSLSAAAFDCSHIGNGNTVTLTVTDAANNVSTCTATVTVLDTIAPDLHCQNATLYLDNNGQANLVVADVLDHEHEPCPITNTWLSQTTFNCANRGTNTVTVFATDNSKNTGTCQATVTVIDNSAPVADVANLPTVTGECSAGVSAPTATDNCVGAVTATTSDATSYSAQGTYTITWTYNDGNGNTTTQTQTVIIQDVSSPVLTLPAPIVVNTSPGQCGSIVNFVATAVDNCAMGTLTYSKAPGTFFDKGVTNVTVTATDAAGNITAGNINVTVLDNEAPTISCPGNMVLNNAAGVCGSAVTYAVTSADNCPGITVVQTDGLPSGSIFPLGVTSNTFVVTDGSGNTATCSFDVTVNQDPNTVVVYTILASDEIHLHDTNMVYGNLGVWKANKKAKIHQDSYVYGFVQAPDIELNNNSSISGAQNLAQAPMPAANTFRYNTMSSNQNINVPDNYAGVYTITGNNFKKIEIGKNTTVKFMNVGDIYIDELNEKGDKNVNTNITFNGNTNLIIRKKMDLDKRNQFNQVGGYTVNVYVEEGDVKVDEYSNVTANIDVRFKDLHVHGKKYGVTTMTGRFIGKKVHGHHLVRWNGACAGPNNVGPTPREWQEAEPMASGETSITARVYPNPNSGAFHVEVQGPAGSNIQAGLHDLTGKKITDLNGIQVNVPYQVNQPMANGVYFIHVDIDGQRQSVKLIRQD